MHAGYTDGHVGTFTPSNAVMMKVIQDRSSNKPDDMKGVFYIPKDALR